MSARDALDGMKARGKLVGIYESETSESDLERLVTAIEAVLGLADEWDVVAEMFPLSAASIFARSHARRVRDALECALALSKCAED